MSEPAAPVKFGLLAWNQYTDWPALRATAMRADELGYDDIWTWDHLYPIVGDWQGPMLEPYLVLGGWAEVTSRARLGLMVGANTFRNPALVAKMITTLDHLSGGRAMLGIGGAWFEREHVAFGFEFGSSPGERLRWLEEAVRIMRGMLHGEQPSGDRYYATTEVRNDPLAGPVAPAPAGRRWRRAPDAADRGPLRRRLQRGRRLRIGEAQGRGAAPPLRGGRPRRVRDRAHRQHGRLHHPRRSGRGAARPGGDLPAQRQRGPLGGPAGRHAGAGRRQAAPVPGDRLPPLQRRLPAAVRRRVDGAPDPRGQADAGGARLRPLDAVDGRVLLAGGNRRSASWPTGCSRCCRPAT